MGVVPVIIDAVPDSPNLDLLIDVTYGGISTVLIQNSGKQ
jgi:hypothetical protein